MNPRNAIGVAALGALFAGKGDPSVKLPVGNRSLSAEAQAELILRAQRKRDRKANRRVAVQTIVAGS